MNQMASWQIDIRNPKGKDEDWGKGCPKIVMKLYNFTNHSQNEHIAFFQQYGFTEITAPMHPEITPDMTEEEIIEVIAASLPDDLAGKHFLVQGMSNVCHYAVTLIQRGGGTAYYVHTKRIRDAHDRFVFLPVALREYATLT